MTILYAAIISHFDLFFNPVFARFSAAVKSESAAKPRGRTGRSRRDLRSGMRAGHTRGGVPPNGSEYVCDCTVGALRCFFKGNGREYAYLMFSI